MSRVMLPTRARGPAGAVEGPRQATTLIGGTVNRLATLGPRLCVAPVENAGISPADQRVRWPKSPDGGPAGGAAERERERVRRRGHSRLPDARTHAGQQVNCVQRVGEKTRCGCLGQSRGHFRRQGKERRKALTGGLGEGGGQLVTDEIDQKRSRLHVPPPRLVVERRPSLASRQQMIEHTRYNRATLRPAGA